MIIYPNQFSQKNIEKTIEYSQIKKYQTIGYTTSLCHHCHGHIPAVKAYHGNSVYLIKSCVTHGLSVHMIERDRDFYDSLICDKNKMNFDDVLLIEASDRCNIQCPHCYHKPDNTLSDVPEDLIYSRISDLKDYGINVIMLAGAEASLHKNFTGLVKGIGDMRFKPAILTNGIRFGNYNFFKDSLDSGLREINVGLNHPSYIGNPTIRKKQLDGIQYASDAGTLSYVGYTMVDMSELDFILNEIISSKWKVDMFRIRAGSEIGINATEKRYYASDIYKEICQWAEKKNMSVRDFPADDNIYHKMIELNGKLIRVIQWCDITDIDLEELVSGPWNDFVPQDTPTNFLHQIIRRDVWKNQGLMLPDKPPKRYQLFHYKNQPKKLNFLSGKGS